MKQKIVFSHTETDFLIILKKIALSKRTYFDIKNPIDLFSKILLLHCKTFVIREDLGGGSQEMLTFITEE